MEFYNQERIFYNTARKRDIENIFSRRENLLKPLNLGHNINEQKWNHYDLMYGHPIDMPKYVDYLRPPALPAKNYPIPYLLQETNNKLVDICGVYYRNKDLPINYDRM